MASIGKYTAKDGRIYTRILFVDPADGRRRTLRLGRVNKEQIATVKGMIERLAKSKATGTPDAVAGAWLAGLPDASYAKLVRVGLAEPCVTPEPEPQSEPQHPLGAFLDEYIKSRVDIKPQTAVVWGHTRRNLISFFGAERDLATITPADADAWRLDLIGQGLSTATVARRCGFAKQFLRRALRSKWIVENPFADLKSGSKGNSGRQYFISREDIERVIAACPDTEWRLIVALARFGGLRCTSEILRLRWADVDWERSRITVHSPKTEHHSGHESRQVPLFPELLPFLREAFEQAEPGTEYAIVRYRLNNLNLGTQFTRIIRKAGLLPWPRRFQNLRSTRETELCETFPEHVVCAWIGNSKMIAREHYLQVTDRHYEEAARTPTGAAHKAAQSEAEIGRKEPKTTTEANHANRVLPVETTACESLQVLAGQALGQGRI
jgi:integrase